ncbi:MAG: GNAT family N-acetyltransferase [Rubrivivax sp.]
MTSRARFDLTRAGLRSGVAELDDYLHRLASQQRERGVGTVFVRVDSTEPSAVLGYCALSAAQFDATALREGDRKRLPRYPVPCFRMGRLACRADRRGQGLGKLLLAYAVKRCQQARRQVAAFALIVDAKVEAAAAFYRHYGFVPCADAPLTLSLALGPAP